MALFTSIGIYKLLYYVFVTLLVLFVFRGMFRLIVWSNKMPKGAFIFLAVFPLISLFPIPPQEIKKLEKVKQEQLKEEDKSGEPEHK